MSGNAQVWLVFALTMLMVELFDGTYFKTLMWGFVILTALMVGEWKEKPKGGDDHG